MAITNLNNIHLTATQVGTAQKAVDDLETALATININLTSEDRQRFGSINEQNKLFVNKVYDFNKNQSSLSAAEVDWAEFEKDFISRQNYEGLIARLESLTMKLKNAKTLHDYDNYQAALTDYAYSSYKAGTAAPGYETKQSELKQFFARSPKVSNTPPND